MLSKTIIYFDFLWNHLFPFNCYLITPIFSILTTRNFKFIHLNPSLFYVSEKKLLPDFPSNPKHSSFLSTYAPFQFCYKFPVSLTNLSIYFSLPCPPSQILTVLIHPINVYCQLKSEPGPKIPRKKMRPCDYQKMERSPMLMDHYD